jgi:hypothetical protein
MSQRLGRAIAIRQQRHIAKPIEKPREAGAFRHISQISSAGGWSGRSMDANNARDALRMRLQTV